MNTRRLLILLLCLTMLFSLIALSGCKREPSSILTGEGRKIDFSTLSDEETVAALGGELASELLRLSAEEDGTENICLSPLSILTALAMAANGASGQTLSEMEEVLGGLPIEKLNGILGAYLANVAEKDGLKVANSVWLRDTLNVNQSFPNVCADYYRAQIYKASFTTQTVEDVNRWVSEHTEGRIDRIIEAFNPDTVMLLINALSFEAEWKVPYDPDFDVTTKPFFGADGEKSLAEYMNSSEQFYIETENATGFIKDYREGYSFVALLPEEGLSVGDYLNTLGETGLMDAVNAATERRVLVSLPKFSYDYEADLTDLLKKAGMPTAMDPLTADFGKMVTDDSQLFISRVIHKTDMTVDTKGTIAAAATAVAVDTYSAEITPSDPLKVELNRPFVYLILDRSAGVPLFVGVVNQP